MNLSAALRRSMTVRISLAIVLVSLLLVGACGFMLDRLVVKELDDRSDLDLLTALTFLNSDLSSRANGLPAVQGHLDDLQLRDRLRVRLVDADGRVLSTPSAPPMPQAALPTEAVDASRLPADADLRILREVRQGGLQAAGDWVGEDGEAWRVLRGRLPRVGAGAGLAAPVDVLLAVEQTKTAEVRRGELRRLGLALVVTAIVAGALGLLVARNLLKDARRMGQAAERIGAEALQERLSLADVPFELEASARAFNRMLDRLQAAFDRLSRFSAEVAHDLRTPIGNLLGEAQVALSRWRSPDEYRAVLESAIEEYERMSRMIGNMLFLARSDNAQTVLDVQSILVEGLLRRVAAYFECVAEERQVEIRTRIEFVRTDEAIVRADDSLATRALGNLLANALRFAPAGSVVLLSARPDGAHGVTIAVSNSGPAIPAQERERIFDRFYRADPSREASNGGSGLGLAIVRSIMVLHGGSVEVESGERTIFTLRFPGLPAATKPAGLCAS